MSTPRLAVSHALDAYRHVGRRRNPYRVTEVVTVAMRSYFSTHQLWAGESSAARAGEIEAVHSGQPRFDIEHRAHVLTAITMSVGFLEAMANELFVDAAEGHGTTDDGYIAPLSEPTHRLMSGWWGQPRDDPRESLLVKYQLLLLFADCPELDPAAQPYQDAHLLVRLRNTIVHYKPETVAAAADPHRLESRLKSKFAENALMSGSGNPWWPDHALGAGCAAWACKSARALADEVVSRLGIEPNYQRLRDEWWPVENHRA